ncbi:MAG: hypothetical protein D9V47_05180 [Clostridia bacterium]|nr:MAG: hypothetical protein D9V47_05180 [Clostridia bacterium]
MGKSGNEKVVKVHLPGHLAGLAGDRRVVAGHGDTVEEVLASVREQFPGLSEALGGAGMASFSIYINDAAVEAREGLRTKVRDGDDIYLVVPLAGG